MNIVVGDVLASSSPGNRFHTLHGFHELLRTTVPYKVSQHPSNNDQFLRPTILNKACMPSTGAHLLYSYIL